MAYDVENLTYLKAPMETMPSGHIALPGRADLADLAQRPIDRQPTSAEISQALDSVLGTLSVAGSESQSLQEAVVRRFCNS